MDPLEPGSRFCTESSGGGGLHVAIPGDDWFFLLRRKDFLPDAAFAVHFGQPIHARGVAAFLPGWRTLNWTTVRVHDLSRTESYAIDGDYQVTLQAHSSSPKDHAAVVSAFQRFMAHAA